MYGLRTHLDKTCLPQPSLRSCVKVIPAKCAIKMIVRSRASHLARFNLALNSWIILSPVRDEDKSCDVSYRLKIQASNDRDR